MPSQGWIRRRFVGKLLEEQDGDVLRKGIRVLSPALMETESPS